MVLLLKGRSKQINIKLHVFFYLFLQKSQKESANCSRVLSPEQLKTIFKS